MKIFYLFLALLLMPFIHAEEGFNIIVLGCGGGPKENNVSGYLAASKGSSDFVALDAGTLLHGIDLSIQKNSFSESIFDAKSALTKEAQILQQHIKAYLISHAHLDHIAGLVINSPADTKKPIFGINTTINTIRDHLFNWKVWPNFGSEGTQPYLQQYEYKRLKIEQKISIPNTNFSLEPFLLSHPGSYLSTAFLLESSDIYLLYVGDTSPDALEPKHRLKRVWERIAPLIRENKLRAIFIECSYPNKHAQSQMFGHLDPLHLMEEMHQLAMLVNLEQYRTALQGLKVIVTHIKDPLQSAVDAKALIQDELQNLNDLHIDFIFAEQGQRLEL